MNIKSKKIKIILLTITLFILYISGSKFINNTSHNIIFKIKSFIPNPVKHFTKNTIFIIPTLKKAIKKLEKENRSLRNTAKVNEIALVEIKKRYFELPNSIVSFSLKKKDKIIRSKYFNYRLTTFQTNDLDNGKANTAKASAYLEEYEDKILLTSADGIFSYFYKEDLNKEKFDSITIASNIKEIINYKEFYEKSEDGIKDILIDDKKIFISFTNQLPDNCYNTSILVAEISFKYLQFDEFFVPNQCVKNNNDYGWINHHIAGGRMVNFKDNKILFSTGAFQYFKYPQDQKSPLGKILSIDKDTGKWNVVSMGHRNIQGLKYSHKQDIIFSTEHGPTGGDEFNINFNPGPNNIKNYGWPIASYGEHGAYSEVKDTTVKQKRYDKAPLYKSHKKYGFIEPIKYYVPSIGITEIEKMPKRFNKNFDNDFFIASMGSIKEEGDLSIHHIKLDEGFKKILKEDIIVIGERIRDLKYIKDINKIILFIENSPGIAVLSHLDK